MTKIKITFPTEKRKFTLTQITRTITEIMDGAKVGLESLHSPLNTHKKIFEHEKLAQK